jgi:D-arabinose 1-dehydrogenase-like Zn-dependent alcohol dehydrogenase
MAGSLLEASIEMLDRRGRLILAGAGNPQILNTQMVVDRQAHIIGSTTQIKAVDVHHVLKLLSEGTFLPVIDSMYPLSRADEAHPRTENELAFGTSVLVPDQIYHSTDEPAQPIEED